MKRILGKKNDTWNWKQPNNEISTFYSLIAIVKIDYRNVRGKFCSTSKLWKGFQKIKDFNKTNR